MVMGWITGRMGSSLIIDRITGQFLPPATCLSVILFTGWGGSPGPHPGGMLRGLARGSPYPHPGGMLRGLAGGSPGPHPGGMLRGLAGGVSRPTPRGEVEGSGWGGLQAHTQGGGWGSGQGVSRPTPRSLQAHTWGEGVYPSMHWGRPPSPADRYCCGGYASYWSTFLFK